MSDLTPARPAVPATLEPARQRVIDQLCEHFAAENLSDDALDERLKMAYQATTAEQLQVLVADLPELRAPGSPAAASRPAVDVARADYVSERQVVVAIMGGAERKGVWTPPQNLHVFALMGGAELDFRDARFGPGVTEVTIFAMMGGVQIVVPPGVNVEMNGMAIMGGFTQTGRTAFTTADANAPVLRIGGFALMGGVEVDVRYPGERPGEARKREKIEAREMKRLK
jgi:hypothetical protein